LKHIRRSNRWKQSCTHAYTHSGPRDRNGAQTRSRVGNRILEDGKLTQFTLAPSLGRETESKVFAPLKDIADCLSTVDLDSANTSTDLDMPASQNSSARLCRHPTAHWTYASNPDGVLPGEQAGSRSRADGYFHRVSAHGEVSPADVSILCEYGKSGKDAARVSGGLLCLTFVDSRYFAQNRDRLFGAATHLFNQDPVRCALYGICGQPSFFNLRPC
jgi:hypothetical protein